MSLRYGWWIKKLIPDFVKRDTGKRGITEERNTGTTE